MGILGRFSDAIYLQAKDRTSIARILDTPQSRPEDWDREENVMKLVGNFGKFGALNTF
jgi:hypothetical protein